MRNNSLMCWRVLYLILFGFGIGGGWVAAHGQTPESMQARLDEEIARLDQERDEAVETLRRQYLGGLERRLATLSGTDREVLAEERDRAQNREQPLRPPIPSAHPGVRHYQDILIAQLDRIEEPRAERIATLVKNLQAFAEAQSTRLRRERQVSQAEAWEQWAAGLPGRYLDHRFSGQTRFFSLLESGQEPYLIIVGTSTSEFPNARINAPWRQCAPGTRANWPGTLAQELSALGKLRLGGATCAGANSSEFVNGSGAYANHGENHLRWVAAEKPDAVIIEFATGLDCADRFDISVAQSRANHEIIIRTLREANPEVEIFLWNGAKSFDQGRRDYGSERQGRDRPSSDEPQEDYAQLSLDLARDFGVGVYYIDTFSIFARILKEQEVNVYRTYFRDGNHTNQRGGEEIIVPEMLKVLQFGNR